MKAMLIDEQKNFNWSDVPDPVIREGTVIIEVHAAALNRADLLQRAGKYPPPPGWPKWMGLEVAGIVIEAVKGSRWKIGDKVCALLGGGGYAERVVVPEGMVMSMPDGLSMEEAASLPEVFATAYLNLYLEAGMKEGDTVLVHAGASGLGIAAIQLAKACGAKVITTVSSDEKAKAVKNLGADIIVNRKTDDLGKALDENPVDIVLDCVGGKGLGENLEKLALGGRWILVATLGGEHAEISLRPILKRGLRLIGSTLRSRSNEMKGLILGQLQEKIWPKIKAGDIRPVIHKVLPIAAAADAHAILEGSANIGKVVLQLKD
ncbi:MAG: NAD(P)H-quinone oxidoreductase [Planctomycetes bacterium]|nr:NAD(P)H-quinone oxidoreductase [Planctomycetota bacterium]